MGELTHENIDPIKRKVIMTGLAIALFAACLDGTITTTCGPTIAKEFNATDLLPWLTTGYLLLETVAIPLAGKLSDLYGRKKLLMIGLAVFGLASLLAGIAWDMWVVILARALQGFGGGILIPVATAAVSDLYAPEERGKIQGALGALFGIGMGAGPLLGGAFASWDGIGGFHGWHFAFLINLVIVLGVLYTCRHEFPSVQVDEKPTIDYIGIALISAALIGVVFYFQLIGKSISIVSWESLIFIVAIIAVLAIFVRHEGRTKEAVIAPHIFSNPTVRGAAIILFLMGFTLVGDELFMGMYLQRVTGHSAVESGLYLLSMVAGMIIASSAGGHFLNKTGIKPWVVAGPILMTIAYFVFSMFTPEFNAVTFCIAEFVFGLGAGCVLASLMTAVQNSCEHKEVGMTTSAVNLMRNIGSTIGTSVLTLISTAVISKECLDSSVPGISDLADTGLGILDHIVEGMTEFNHEIYKIFTDSIGTAFFFGAILLLIAVVVGLRYKIQTVEQTKEIREFTEEVTKDNGKV